MRNSISGGLSKRPWLAIFLLAVVVRVVWWLGFAPWVLGEYTYVHPDTPTFVNAARNLIETGTYASDPEFRDALFTRVPGYALIWAALSFLPGVTYIWMAAIQAVLDSATAVLLFLVGSRLGARWVAGIVYAFYPFALLWVTPSLPDVMTTFGMIATVSWATLRPPTWRNAAVFGILTGLLGLTREYAWVVLAALGPWVWGRGSARFVVGVLLSAILTSAAVYSPWPLRNVLIHGEWVVMRSQSSGYREYDRDIIAAIQWMNLWTTFPHPQINALAAGEPIKAPDWVYADEAARRESERLFARMRECGRGTRAWARMGEVENDCTDDVAEKLRAMSAKLIRRQPLRTWVVVPLQNLSKILFKSSLSDERATTERKTMARVAFSWRTLLLVLGCLGLAFDWQNRRTWTFVAPALGLYLAMAFVIRGIQMRYLLQADVLMLIPAAALLSSWWTRAVSQRQDDQNQGHINREH